MDTGKGGGVKLARLLISNELVREILCGRAWGPCQTDAPADLKIHGFIPKDASPWTMELVVESDTFADVEEGAALPEVSFTYSRAS